MSSYPISGTTIGDNSIVKGIGSQFIKVYAYTIQALGTVSAKWKDGPSNNLTGAFSFQAREGISSSIVPPGFLFKTSKGNDLILNLSAAVEIVGHVCYWYDID